MSVAPRVVPPDEAQRWLRGSAVPITWCNDLCFTVATEPDRIRAAVVKALRWSCENGHYAAAVRADAIEKGADW